jgi:hypothetical protein
VGVEAVMTQDEIIEMAKKYCSNYKFENGDLYECYEFSKEDLIALIKSVEEEIKARAKQ